MTSAAVVFTVHGRCLGKNANGREHWAAKAKRVSNERARVHGALLVQVGAYYTRKLRELVPCVVTFTRTGPRLLDSDNLQSSAAAVRDEVAAILGVTDGPTDARARWVYDQRKGEYGLEVKIVRQAAVEGAA